MIRKGQVRWLPKGDILVQIQFIREILGLKTEKSTDEIGDWFGFADRIVFATQPQFLISEDLVQFAAQALEHGLKVRLSSAE